MLKSLYLCAASFLFTFLAAGQDKRYDYSDLLKTGFDWNMGMYFDKSWGGGFLDVPESFQSDMKVERMAYHQVGGGIIYRYGRMLELDLGMQFGTQRHQLEYSEIYSGVEGSLTQEDAEMRYFGFRLGVGLRLHQRLTVGLFVNKQISVSYIGTFTIRDRRSGSVVQAKSNHSNSPLTNEFNTGTELGIRVRSPLKITPNIWFAPEVGYGYFLTPFFSSEPSNYHPNGHVENSAVHVGNFQAGFRFFFYFEYREKYSQGR